MVVDQKLQLVAHAVALRIASHRSSFPGHSLKSRKKKRGGAYLVHEDGGEAVVDVLFAVVVVAVVDVLVADAAVAADHQVLFNGLQVPSIKTSFKQSSRTRAS